MTINLSRFTIGWYIQEQDIKYQKNSKCFSLKPIEMKRCSTEIINNQSNLSSEAPVKRWRFYGMSHTSTKLFDVETSKVQNIYIS